MFTKIRESPQVEVLRKEPLHEADFRALAEGVACAIFVTRGDGLQCGAIDTATRYGGDEFAVVLAETTAAAARLAASRICNRVALDGQPPPLSVSTGLAVYPQDGTTLEALLRAADHEVYGMKIWEEGSAPPKLATDADWFRPPGAEHFPEKVKARRAGER